MNINIIINDETSSSPNSSVAWSAETAGYRHSTFIIYFYFMSNFILDEILVTYYTKYVPSYKIL